jgi:hypothetical protein
MSQDHETLRKNSKEIEAYLTRHCTIPNGVILVEAGDTRGIFTTFEKAIAFAKSLGRKSDLSTHMLDDPEFMDGPSMKMH